MGKFESRFYKFLEQDEQTPDQTPDQEAMVATLDPETNPDDLGADVNANAAKAIAQREEQMLNKIREWVSKLQEFTEYLNGTTPGSVQSILNGAEADTILDKIKTTEVKKITRTATELAGLSETLKGYLGTASNPKYKYV